MLKKGGFVLIGLVVGILFSSVALGQSADFSSPALQAVVEAERLIYGAAQEGPLLPRIESLETMVYGGPQAGALLSRAERVAQDLRGSLEGNSSFMVTLNALEWTLFSRANEGPFLPRLERVEILLYGQPKSGTLSQRMMDLVALTWPDGRLPLATVTVPAGTEVKIKLLKELSTAGARVGDEVPYQVAENLILNGNLVLPAGITGTAKIHEVKKAGPIGRDGRLILELGEIKALNGVAIPLQLPEETFSRRSSFYLALGVGLGTAVLVNNPLGLVAGYFIRGKDEVFPTGSVVTATTGREVQVSALGSTR